MAEKIRYIVSACLAGMHTRYDGGATEDPEFIELVRRGLAIPLCPEQLGGLSTPREPAEFRGGDGNDVLEGRARLVGLETGEDKTLNFLKGAREVLRIAELVKPEEIILKEDSPSCGLRCVYIDGVLQKGSGVTAALLVRKGFKVRGVQSRCEKGPSKQV